MHIGGLGSIPNSQSGSASQPVDPKPPAETDPPEDTLEIRAESASGERGPAPDVRTLRLAQIKAAIEAGEYETQDKLDAALSRLFEELEREDD